MVAMNLNIYIVDFVQNEMVTVLEEYSEENQKFQFKTSEVLNEKIKKKMMKNCEKRKVY